MVTNNKATQTTQDQQYYTKVLGFFLAILWTMGAERRTQNGEQETTIKEWMVWGWNLP
jgi:hypothetical protein